MLGGVFHPTVCATEKYCSALDRQVCKTLRHIVHSSRLQYTIDLGLHRMLSLDHSGKALPFHTRRKLLRECESNWRHFRWRQKHTLDLFALGSIYELTGGFYGNAMPPFVTLVELPSATTDSALDTPGRSWFFSMPDIAVVDFTMDPAQDLLVLLAYAPSEFVTLHCSYFLPIKCYKDLNKFMNYISRLCRRDKTIPGRMCLLSDRSTRRHRRA